MPLPSTFLNDMEEDEGVNPKHPENVGLRNLERKVSIKVCYTIKMSLYKTVQIIISHIILHYAILDRNMTREVCI